MKLRPEVRERLTEEILRGVGEKEGNVFEELLNSFVDSGDLTRLA